MDTAAQLYQEITVTAAARLHVGFFDLTHTSNVTPSNATGDAYGRSFGGLGLAIDSPCTRVQIANSNQLNIDANSGDNVVKIVENFIKSFNLPTEFSLKVLQKIPEHAGLGSGTQMALVIGAGLSQLFHLDLSAAQIAAASMRGRRSGIGLGAFSQGGFLVDSGKLVSALPSGELPSIDARIDFPENWRILLVQDSAHIGVHGTAESEAFKTLKPAQFHLKTMIQQHLLPALQRADLLAFGAYMQDLQAYNGDYFSPVQGGRYASKDVAEVLAWLQNNTVACVGQSSWGPTGFAIVDSVQRAESLQNAAKAAFSNKPNISFSIVRGKNTGASILLE